MPNFNHQKYEINGFVTGHAGQSGITEAEWVHLQTHPHFSTLTASTMARILVWYRCRVNQDRDQQEQEDRLTLILHHREDSSVQDQREGVIELAKNLREMFDLPKPEDVVAGRSTSCPACRGVGLLTQDKLAAMGLYKPTEVCDNCQGRGYITSTSLPLSLELVEGVVDINDSQELRNLAQVLIGRAEVIEMEEEPEPKKPEGEG